MAIGIALTLASAAAAASPPQAVVPASATASQAEGTAALALFHSDVALNYWALKHYDSDGDVVLSPQEAAQAASALKVIADSDGDGHVTTYEFDRAREFIAARF